MPKLYAVSLKVNLNAKAVSVFIIRRGFQISLFICSHVFSAHCIISMCITSSENCVCAAQLMATENLQSFCHRNNRGLALLIRFFD
jgi:hypothetical protein